MKPYVITIARQYGSGGKTVGKRLAERLDIPFYDREIITMASEDSGVNAVLFSDERLMKGGDLRARLRSIYRGEKIPGYRAGIAHEIKEDTLYQYQAKVIRSLAEQGPCIMMGRCADYLLRDRGDVVRVFVHADPAFCLQQAMKVNSMDPADVQKKIDEVDHYRAEYYQYHTGLRWSDARNYDLSLNSGTLGFDGTLDAILAYLETRSKYDA